MTPPRPQILQPTTAKLGPCEICHGERYIDTEDGRKKPCRCVLRHRMFTYLTPDFADGLWVKPADGFDTARLVGRNVFVQNSAKWADAYFNFVYRSAVKSFLLNNGGRISFHTCLGGKEVADAAYSDDLGQGVDYGRLEAVDLLILYLAGDPPNRHYSQLLTSLIKGRVLRKRPSWVVTSYSLIPDDGALDRYYGREFVDYVKPRQQNDQPAIGGGHFTNLDLTPIVHAFKRTQAQAA